MLISGMSAIRRTIVLHNRKLFAQDI